MTFYIEKSRLTSIYMIEKMSRWLRFHVIILAEWQLLYVITYVVCNNLYLFFTLFAFLKNMRGLSLALHTYITGIPMAWIICEKLSPFSLPSVNDRLHSKQNCFQKRQILDSNFERRHVMIGQLIDLWLQARVFSLDIIYKTA